jgi:hypothetical protein
MICASLMYQDKACLLGAAWKHRISQLGAADLCGGQWSTDDGSSAIEQKDPRNEKDTAHRCDNRGGLAPPFFVADRDP